MRSRVFAFLLCFLLVLPLLAVVPVVGQGQLVSNYEIEGDHVWIDDAFVNLEVWPHTTSGGWVYLNFTSKQFGGVVDVVFGFDRETHRPRKFQVYSPHTVTDYFDEGIPDYYYMPRNASEWSYTIEGYNSSWSWVKVSGRKLSEAQVFRSGTVTFYHKDKNDWLIQKRIAFSILDNRAGRWHVYWQIDTLVEWAAAKGRLDFEHKVFRFAGMSDWFMLTVDVVKGKSYHARFWLDILPKIDGEYGEYWVAVKRHSDSILEAIQNRRFYALDPWWNASWDYKVKLTIDADKIDADLTDFPVAVFFDAGNMNWSNVQDDLDDFRFVDSTEAVLLDAELEDYTTNTDAVIHVRIPSVDDAVDTDFYCYFGNDAASAAWDAEGVWDSNFVMVQHMVDDPDTSHIADSTSNNNDGHKEAANEPVEISSGKLNSAQRFDGNNDQITVAHTASFVSTSRTVEVWIKTATAIPATKAITIKGSDGTWFGTFLYASNGGGGKPYLYQGVDWKTGSYTIYDAAWHYVVATVSPTTTKIYTDGNAPDTWVVGSNLNANVSVYIGCGKNGPLTAFIDADIDEVRYSVGTTRSDAWFKASYYSGMDGLLTYGGEEEALPPTVGEFSCPAIVYPSKSTFWNVTARYDLGRTSIKNATLTFEGGVELLWIESTKVFSETADASGYFTLGTGTYIEENATSYVVCFKGTFASGYPEGYKDGDAEVWTDDDLTASATETDWFLFTNPPNFGAAAFLLMCLVCVPIMVVLFSRRRR